MNGRNDKADSLRRRPDAGQETEHPPRYRAAELFGAARELLIEHRGATYRLRITRQGKLILNK